MLNPYNCVCWYLETNQGIANSASVQLISFILYCINYNMQFSSTVLNRVISIILYSPLQDTAGEEKYAALSAFYCRGASVAILAFDLTDATSLDKLIETFIPLLEDSVTNCLTLVAGTKLDLVDTKGRQIKSSQGEELAEELYRTQLESAKGVQDTCLKGLDPKRLYFETSAKTGEGVGGLFEHAQSVLLPLLRKTMPKGTKSSSKITVLNSEPPAGKSRCCSS